MNKYRPSLVCFSVGVLMLGVGALGLNYGFFESGGVITFPAGMIIGALLAMFFHHRDSKTQANNKHNRVVSGNGKNEQ